jgi:hypothetical protein
MAAGEHSVSNRPVCSRPAAVRAAATCFSMAAFAPVFAG